MTHDEMYALAGSLREKGWQPSRIKRTLLALEPTLEPVDAARIAYPRPSACGNVFGLSSFFNPLQKNVFGVSSYPGHDSAV